MPELHRQLTQAREIFGQFLRNWRKANGWVITTPQDWAKACPEIIPPGLRVSSGQWANLENAQIKQAQPSTFLQLAVLNQALASDERGSISDRLLSDRVYGAKPVLRDDGTAWGPEDWFACYIGNLEGPPELWPRREDPETLPNLEELKQRYSELVSGHGLRPVTALLQLLGSDPDLSTAQQLLIEGALLQDEALDSEGLLLLRSMLNNWEILLREGGKPGRRRTRE